MTFGLHSEGHVVGRVVSLPEVSETLVGVDVFLSGFVLQSLGVACRGKQGYGSLLLSRRNVYVETLRLGLSNIKAQFPRHGLSLGLDYNVFQWRYGGQGIFRFV